MKTKTDIISLDNQTSNLYKVTLSGREFTAVGVTDDHVNNNVPTPDDNTPQVESYNMNVASSVNEGQDLPVTITTGNVANGTKLYWTVTNTGNGDFVAETGDFTINNDTSSFNITPILDFTTEGPEGFYIRIRTNSVTGNEVATSPLITINDTSSTPTPPVPTYSIVSTATNINEGVALPINVITANVTNGTQLYWSVAAMSTPTINQDFIDLTGSVTITNNSGSFNVFPKLDQLTEGPEVFVVLLRLNNSINGSVVAYSGLITINDTSFDGQDPEDPDPEPEPENPTPSPAYNLAGPATINENGGNNNYTVSTANVADTTILYWSINGTLNDFTAINGFFTITTNMGNFNLAAIADKLTEIDESYTISIRTGTTSGTVVATLPITVKNTSSNTSIPTALATSSIDTAQNTTIATEVNIFANFDTTSVLDPERNYYNLPQNELPVLNQITASTRLLITKDAPIDKIAISTTGIDGIGYNDNTFNLDTNYFKNQIIYFTVRVKTVNNYPAKYLNNLSLGDGRDTPDTIFLELVDNGGTLTTTFSSDFGNLSADVHGGYFKGVFKYNGIGDNIKIKARVNSNNIVIRGESNIFNIVPALNGKEFRKINEDNDQRENFINYLYQPNLKNNPKFFTDIIGQIVGDSVDPNTLGVKVYEKISNFLINSNDIDYANIDNLISSLKLIDSNVNKFSEKYPASLKRIVDFFSANKSKIKPIKNYFNQSFDDKGRPSSGLGKNLGPEITMTQTLTGGIYFEPIVAYEKFSQRYYLLNTDPTSSYDFRYLGSNRTFELSSYNTRWGWGLDLPGGVGSFTYMLDASGNNLILEDSSFRILNEQGGIPTSEIPKYYTFYEYIPTIDNSNIFAFYDDKNINSNLDLTTLSGIDNSIDEIILKDIYLGTNLI